MDCHFPAQEEKNIFVDVIKIMPHPMKLLVHLPKEKSKKTTKMITIMAYV